MMKKFWVLMAALCVLFCTGAMAEDLGVQIVGGETTSEPTYLDDVQLGERYEIPGYARVLPVSYEVRDSFFQYEVGHAGSSEKVDTTQGNGRLPYWFDTWDDIYVTYYTHVKGARSGEDARFAMFEVDLVNLHMDTHLFAPEATVKFIYADTYEYIGWVRQYNPDFEAVTYSGGYGSRQRELGRYRVYIQPADEIPVDMVGTGHYIFGCTLPKAVAEGTEPLRVEIFLGDHFIVYNIRK